MYAASVFVCIGNVMFEEQSIRGVNHLAPKSDSRWPRGRSLVSQYLKVFCLSRPHDVGLKNAILRRLGAVTDQIIYWF